MARDEDPSENMEEVFKTLTVTFETLLKNAKTTEQKARAERLRKGILEAEGLCGIDLASPTYRFLTPEDGPWYGEPGY